VSGTPPQFYDRLCFLQRADGSMSAICGQSFLFGYGFFDHTINYLGTSELFSFSAHAHVRISSPPLDMVEIDRPYRPSFSEI